MAEHGYEYLDHTADIQVHSWGINLEEAFVNTSHAMLDYMYERESVEEQMEAKIEVEGNSLNRLLYNFLEEVLYIFSCDPYMAVKSVNITELITQNHNGILYYRIKGVFRGEEYERIKHGSKTEIKAVTFSNMNISVRDDEEEKRVDIYIIFDI